MRLLNVRLAYDFGYMSTSRYLVLTTNVTMLIHALSCLACAGLPTG